MDDEILTIEEAARKLAHEHVDGLSPEHLTRLAGPVASWEDDFAAHVWHTHQEHAAFCEKQHYLKNKDLESGKTQDFALPATPAPLPIKPPPPWLHKSNAEEVEAGRRMALWAYSAKDFAKRLLQSIGNGTLTTRDAVTGGNSIECTVIDAKAYISLSEARECLRVQHRINLLERTTAPATEQAIQEQPPTAATIAEQPEPTDDENLASLFDPVTVAQLEAMFPANGKWERYAERSGRNGLKEAAKTGRARFNPYRAALWWLSTGPTGWKLERCLRVLANNLPARSRDSKHLLTGDFE